MTVFFQTYKLYSKLFLLNYFCAPFQMNKPVNKQDEPWIKPFVNQFSNMNFSVSVVLCSFI